MTGFCQVIIFYYLRINPTWSWSRIIICLEYSELLYIKEFTEIFRSDYIIFLSFIYLRINVGTFDWKIFYWIRWWSVIYFGKISFFIYKVPFYMNQFTPEALKGINGTLVGTLASTGAFVAFLLGFGYIYNNI